MSHLADQLKLLRDALKEIVRIRDEESNGADNLEVSNIACNALKKLATLEASPLAARQEVGVNHYDMSLAFDFDDGTSLYVRDNEAGGRSYYSDEVGCGVLVWDTVAVSRKAIEAALAYDATYEGCTTPPAAPCPSVVEEAALCHELAIVLAKVQPLPETDDITTNIFQPNLWELQAEAVLTALRERGFL